MLSLSPPATNHEFVPSAFQERILTVLAGRALPTEELARAVGEPHLFFSGRGGFWELRHWGLIVHDAQIGNYRPDDPPPGIPAALCSARASRCDPAHAGVNPPHLVACRPGQDV